MRDGDDSGMQRISSFSIQELERIVLSHDIGYLYELLDYDYADASQDGDRAQIGSLSRRDLFLQRLCLLREPTSEEIRRFFNQVNAAFAEKWALVNTAASPSDFLIQTNQLLLYRQGKRLGLRNREIGFGTRVDLDVVDPLRGYKVLTGISPQFLTDTLADWYRAVESSEPHQRLALALSMCLIAIHPFTDANGRAGRLAFTWLCRRWGIQPAWLSEGADGELLRTGAGVHSTEHLMAQLMIRAAEGHNRGFPYADSNSPTKAAAALSRTLRNLPTFVESREFTTLHEHLTHHDHIRTASPRFQSIRDFICS